MAFQKPQMLQKTAGETQAVASRDLVNRARTYASLSPAQSTAKGYRSDWARFEAWCGAKGFRALPTAPATVALYLTDRADSGGKVATLQRSLAAISKAHKSCSAAPESCAVGRRATPHVLGPSRNQDWNPRPISSALGLRRRISPQRAGRS